MVISRKFNPTTAVSGTAGMLIFRKFTATMIQSGTINSTSVIVIIRNFTMTTLIVISFVSVQFLGQLQHWVVWQGLKLLVATVLLAPDAAGPKLCSEPVTIVSSGYNAEPGEHITGPGAQQQEVKSNREDPSPPALQTSLLVGMGDLPSLGEDEFHKKNMILLLVPCGGGKGTLALLSFCWMQG
ncbi:hypothetical protein FN846DRAFT_893247 [Sphaerosporella brunnea]|uniref:Uncharacterized protein n=1 Tax=Sphaerosporella brunnea TaxID=1250544 RepID=A0A5J5ELA9_9PEZI|nr:hypothetical protein FN846DRAFT_893247 [Sphaerosporella brunnea]